ncbi:F-box/LRR-repeat protein 4 [Cinnamomum micranthum f. kanehirae]|uniref:F-box/LRR-repeat protein 4 n=1 Tax=Cinnamomum micranthum f. kanehirae TaxID=337451 RepID=A0A443NDP6_9MAGN|nr:F-box/LRR-repeat protein 4 [Cinnamomum micranthum f. kanehirae]
MIAQNTRFLVGKEVQALYPKYLQDEYLHVNPKELAASPSSFLLRCCRCCCFFFFPYECDLRTLNPQITIESPKSPNRMRGHDLINTVLPDELILEIFRRLDGFKSSCDACSLVCRRWLNLERASRRTLRIGATGNPDAFVRIVVRRFSAVRNIFIDERLPISPPFPSLRQRSPRSNPRKRRSGKKNAGSSSKLQCMIEDSTSEGSEFEPFSLSDAGLTTLAKGCTRLEKLSLIWCSNVTSVGLYSIAENCRTLKSLDLQGCYINDQGLAAVGEFCKQLEDLNLRFCEGLTDTGLVELALGCGKSLKSLSIAACAKITDTALEAVGSYCASLQTLSLDSEFIKNQGVLAVVKGCRSLKALKLECINVTDEALQAVGAYSLSLELLALYSFQRFTDGSLCAVGNGCKKLTNLTLSDCYFLSDKSLEAIAQGCTGLTHLEVNGCHNIGTSGLASIGRSCPCVFVLSPLNGYISFKEMMTWIRFSRKAIVLGAKGGVHERFLLPSKSPASMLGDCQQARRTRQFSSVLILGASVWDARGLSELSLLYCQRIGNNALLEVGRGCTLLQVLHLVDCSSIGDDAIYNIALGCRNLKKLHIRRCYEIGDKGIIAVGQNCKFLTDLSLRFCDRVGDDALIAIGQCCFLRHLNVSGCHRIGDAGLIAIARGCPQLTNLDVSVLQNIRDIALAEIGEGCPLLKEIVLSHCRQITDVGLAHLVKRCTQLESCHMVYCPLVTAAGVATMVSSCMNMKRVLVEKWKVSQRTRRRAGSILSFLCMDL